MNERKRRYPLCPLLPIVGKICSSSLSRTNKLSRSDRETCTEFLVETNGLRLEHAGSRYDILEGSMLVSRIMRLLKIQSSGNFQDKCICSSIIERSTN